jgi:hypothetical protein
MHVKSLMLRLGLCALSGGMATLPMPALAEVPAVIRPTKLITTELAVTLPEGVHLFSVYSGGIELGMGLSHGIQVDVGGGNWAFLPAFNGPLYVRVKDPIAQCDLATVGIGAYGATSVNAAGLIGNRLQGFVPITVTPLPGLFINLAPNLTLDMGLSAGLSAGVGYFITPDLALVAEDTVGNFSPIVMLGAGYGGLNSRASLSGGLLFSGAGVGLFEALAIGF